MIDDMLATVSFAHYQLLTLGLCTVMDGVEDFSTEIQIKHES